MTDTEFKTIRELSINNNITQRELSKRLGMSLGAINYVIKALIKKGYVRAQRFKNSNNKIGYIYALTPKWLYDKTMITQEFIQKKMAEYEHLKKEIEMLEREL
ncbi:MAG TPA: MarR family EPS-associated transcriptional regulator [Syntrophorhabdaceae bacterium]|nr:MarR family EPS-associated transcriptional regulator [Syntrophorhabdaceae bacterium]